MPKPDRLLDQETMTDIVFDLAVLQAADGIFSDKLVQNNINSNTFIYKKYKHIINYFNIV